MFLSHFEVLSEVLISAPPIGMDHTDLLVLPHLMEIGISDIILLPVGGEPSVGMGGIVMLIDFSDMPLPSRDHALLLLLSNKTHNERLI